MIAQQKNIESVSFELNGIKYTLKFNFRVTKIKWSPWPADAYEVGGTYSLRSDGRTIVQEADYSCYPAIIELDKTPSDEHHLKFIKYLFTENPDDLREMIKRLELG
jgi:hypothetical protein